MSDYLDINNEELLKDFFSEAEQQVEQLESNVLVIENDPSNHEAIDEIFRAAHTLKGGSATVEMMELAEFTHTVEDLLDVLRDGTITVSEPVVDVLLDSIDVIKSMLEARSNGSVYTQDVSEISVRLRSFLPATSGKKQKSSVPTSVKPVLTQKVSEPEPSIDIPASTSLSDADFNELKSVLEPSEKLWRVAVKFDEANPMNSVGGIQAFAALKDCGRVLKTIPDFDSLYEDTFYPVVEYFIASSMLKEALSKAVSISDVTLGADISILVAPGGGSVAPVVASVSVESQPAAVVEPIAQVAEQPVALGDKKVEPTKKNAASGGAHLSGSVLRVESKRIDYLLNLVSETVITKAAFNQNGILFGELQTQLQDISNSYKVKVRRLFDQLPLFLEEIANGTTVKDMKKELQSEYGDLFSMFDGYEATLKSAVSKYRSSVQNLGRIAGELQEGVMKIRMVPISQIFGRFPRVVRDLSRELNKKVNLVIEGEETELDKSVIEELYDPLMHCVRNSLDHGLESPEDRMEAGKEPEGIVKLTASNEGNLIVIQISDDGAGINVEKVKQKAISRGLIHPNKVLSDMEAFQLIFEPGFSTADKITNVSGRGVGLDVVRTQIDKLNGSVAVFSEHGIGTTFTIKLPLTMAIIQGLLVRVGREVYSIPVTSVIESFRIKSDEINKIDNYEVFNVRDEVISLLRLNRLFGIQVHDTNEYSFIVVVGTEEKKIGLMVDALIGEEDVVIKPLKDQFTNSPGIAGASILGDGSVSLIIDVSQLLDLGLKQELQARERRDAAIW